MRFVRAAAQVIAGLICGNFVSRICQAVGFSWLETMIFILAIAVLMMFSSKSD
jgi:hypothetical protein